MGLSRPARSFGLATAALALAAAGTSVPASAAEGVQLKLTTYRGVLTLGADPDGKWRPGAHIGPTVHRLNKVDGHDLVLSYDFKDLAGIAEPVPTPNCTASGTVLRCTESKPLTWDYLPIDNDSTPGLRTAAGAKLQDKGVLHITATAANATAPVTVDLPVHIGGPLLELKHPDAVRDTTPGSTVSSTLQITNNGELPATRVYLSAATDRTMPFAERFGNCEYGTPRTGEPTRTAEAMICAIDSPIAPGETVTVDPVRFRVGPDAYWSEMFLRVGSLRDELAEDRLVYVPESPSAPHLTFGKPEGPATAQPGGPSQYDAEFLTVTARNSADLEATGVWAPSTDGSTGTLTIGLANHGPASFMGTGVGAPVPTAAVVLPEGVQVTRTPENCYTTDQRGPRRYTCYGNYRSLAGEHRTHAFELAVGSGARGATAVVQVQDMDHLAGAVGWNTNPANDRVELVLGSREGTGGTPGASPTATTPAGTAGPQPTATAGTGSAAPSPSRSASASATATATASPSGTAVTGPLAATGGGAAAGPIAAAGATAVALGVVLLVAVRRRAASRR
ncbi:hypothetical protein ACIA8O_34775 [Kitasatospora sp. NPDC051853]|uniref:hypothetical protein n=1 Tax=Kitasatospora sp. NPDC051853 TaxID=3364058 RepID=UPI0037B1CCCA